ncbi:MAG: mannose-1-phosphate guanylyltransferase [Myxococcales bacterium]|nr:mannose-1-phosphate guanylyltransferase [Myxococcales bacterium]
MKIVAVVMAGGQGTRFWPLSRKHQPKQLLHLLGEESMLARTIRRLKPLMPVENILVVTGRGILDAVREELPDLPVENILAEPQGRNTAPCVAWASAVVRDRWGADTVIATLPADHYIGDEDGFRAVCESACAYAERGDIVTLGITPSHPETGYGYLQFGEDCTPIDGVSHRARKLEAFVEKPSLDVATSYLQAGNYLWNSGMFFFRADVILDEFRAHLPDVLDQIERVSAAAPEHAEAVLEDAYQQCTSISIDHGIMEHSSRLATIPASFGWSDVGNWRALLDLREEGNDSFELGSVVSEDTSESVLVADEGVTLVALGLRGMTVVACGDVTLALPTDRAQEVRQLVELLDKSGRSDLID